MMKREIEKYHNSRTHQKIMKIIVVILLVLVCGIFFFTKTKRQQRDPELLRSASENGFSSPVRSEQNGSARKRRNSLRPETDEELKQDLYLSNLINNRARLDPDDVFNQIIQKSSGDERQQYLTKFFEDVAFFGKIDKGIELLSRLEPDSHRSAVICAFWLNVHGVTLSDLNKGLVGLQLTEDFQSFYKAIQNNPRIDSLLKYDFLANQTTEYAVKNDFKLLYGIYAVVDSKDYSKVAQILSNRNQEECSSVWKNAFGRILEESPMDALTIAQNMKSKLSELAYNQSITDVVSNLVSKNPNEAANVALQVANKSEMNAAVFGLVAPWFNQNSMECSRWISELQPSPLRDNAISHMVRLMISKKDYQTAEEWIPQIQSKDVVNDLERELKSK